jgi:hypothetical protein
VVLAGDMQVELRSCIFDVTRPSGERKRSNKDHPDRGNLLIQLCLDFGLLATNTFLEVQHENLVPDAHSDDPILGSQTDFTLCSRFLTSFCRVAVERHIFRSDHTLVWAVCEAGEF